MSVSIRFVPRDLWVGVYAPEPEFVVGTVRRVRGRLLQGRRRRVYVCIVPCLPIIFERTVWK